VTGGGVAGDASRSARPGDDGAPRVRVRRARHEDWPSVRALLREIDQLHAAIAPDYFRASERADDEWRHLLEDTTGAAFVAGGDPHGKPGSRIAGVVVVKLYDTPSSSLMVPRRRGHVETLVVAAAQRRRGVGRRLMDEAVAWARACGAQEMVLTTWTGNDEAEAFYRRLGYRVLSRVFHAPL
jgi:ribosomal protein S18 acetylase RimI-like enzyme